MKFNCIETQLLKTSIYGIRYEEESLNFPLVDGDTHSKVGARKNRCGFRRRVQVHGRLEISFLSRHTDISNLIFLPFKFTDSRKSVRGAQPVKYQQPDHHELVATPLILHVRENVWGILGMLTRDRALPDSIHTHTHTAKRIERFIRLVASPRSNTSVYVCPAVSEGDVRRNAV